MTRSSGVTTTVGISAVVAAYSLANPVLTPLGVRSHTSFFEGVSRLAYGASMGAIGYLAYQHGAQHGTLETAVLGAGTGFAVGAVYGVVKRNNFPDPGGFLPLPSLESMLPWMSLFAGAVYSVAGKYLAPLSIHLQYH